MCVDSKGDTDMPVNLWQCHQQGGNQVKSHAHNILKYIQSDFYTTIQRFSMQILNKSISRMFVV